MISWRLHSLFHLSLQICHKLLFSLFVCLIDFCNHVMDEQFKLLGYGGAAWELTPRCWQGCPICTESFFDYLTVFVAFTISKKGTASERNDSTDFSNKKHRSHELQTFATEMEVLRRPLSWESWTSRGSNLLFNYERNKIKRTPGWRSG